MTRPGWLGETTWPELVGRRCIPVVPRGAIEQRGPHLPLDADGPTLAHGVIGEHAGVPGTVSIGSTRPERWGWTKTSVLLSISPVVVARDLGGLR